MSWTDIRTRLASDFAAVAITSPVAQTIKRVYDKPPVSIEDTPCFVILPPAVSVERGPNNRRVKTYTIRIRLYIQDENVATAADLLDAYREAVIDMLDSEVALGQAGGVVVVNKEEHPEPGGVRYQDKDYIAQDTVLTVLQRESRQFSH